ncbi:hypothetical protein [Burkholderia gladioli]|uniref:hypothetical protein n=1 Tax=Burkholderia gladioli TaxID=28095 RepID=UPI001C5E1EFA|nr:hypothetical protein [Burkholderia gladioli]MBW5287881.1 hypothetical protein [Burkholderia gladioli]
MTENLTLSGSPLQRFAARHSAALAGLGAVLAIALLVGSEQWVSAQRQADEDRQIAEHGCSRLAPEAGKPARILCPGNRIISRPSPVF